MQLLNHLVVVLAEHQLHALLVDEVDQHLILGGVEMASTYIEIVSFVTLDDASWTPLQGGLLGPLEGHGATCLQEGVDLVLVLVRDG